LNDIMSNFENETKCRSDEMLARQIADVIKCRIDE
jgi:hypothetical protein